MMRKYILPPLVLELLFFSSLFIGNAVCLAASIGGTNKNPPQSLPKIACVISTNRNGGESQAYAFPSSATSGNDKNASSTNTTSSLMPHKQAVELKTRHPSIVRGIQSSLQATFFPIGWPQSTPRGYLSYSIWSWIQDLSTQMRGVVATQRILEGVGVGREGASALSALYHYLTRDGCGMFATLAFTRLAASRFHTDVKRWRLFADFMVDVGITLEVAAIQSKETLFLPMICMGNMCKAICGVAAGACNGAIHLHWAGKGRDISDVNAKFGAQQSLTGSLGLVVAALFAKEVSEVPPKRLWILYTLLTLLHLYANTQCMRQIAFDYMNQERLRMAVAEFWARPIVDDDDQTFVLPTPRQVSRREPLWFAPFRRRTPRERNLVRVPIEFGVSFDEFTTKSGWGEDDVHKALVDEKQDPSYLIATGRHPRSNKLCIVVALVSQATALQQTKAYFHALLLKRRLGEAPYMSDEIRRSVEQQTASEVEKEWIHFRRACRIAGWDLKRSELQSKGYEIAIQYRRLSSPDQEPPTTDARL